MRIILIFSIKKIRNLILDVRIGKSASNVSSSKINGLQYYCSFLKNSIPSIECFDMADGDCLFNRSASDFYCTSNYFCLFL